jgi:hypothetical protein
VISYEEEGLVDILDLLKRKGTTEKYDGSTFMGFPLHNLDP